LRLEKYPHRMNFAKGVLECHKQTYKHLTKLLKTIPLESPTEIELKPGKWVRVTLFDANHCVGSTMFLVEGDGKAILYTGDVRSESWFVNSLARHPALIPYTHGIVALDCIYLDTSNIMDPTKSYATKAQGLREIILKMRQYPDDQVFHFNAWTFGYEEVYIALSAAFKCVVSI
jgi:DNA cross-link repair 1C protein